MVNVGDRVRVNSKYKSASRDELVGIEGIVERLNFAGGKYHEVVLDGSVPGQLPDLFTTEELDVLENAR